MLYSSAVEQLKIGSYEYFDTVEDIPETPTEVKAYFPKLMPHIALGDAPTTGINLYINRNIFANAPECAVMTTVTVAKGQNYLTIKPYSNERPNFRSKAVFENDRYVVKKHTRFIASVMNGDISRMYITSRSGGESNG